MATACSTCSKSEMSEWDVETRCRDLGHAALPTQVEKQRSPSLGYSGLSLLGAVVSVSEAPGWDGCITDPSRETAQSQSGASELTLDACPASGLSGAGTVVASSLFQRPGMVAAMANLLSPTFTHAQGLGSVKSEKWSHQDFGPRWQGATTG